MSESTSVAIRPSTPVAVGAPPEATFQELMKLGKELVATGFLPVAIKTPAQAVAVILTGRELGLGPMQSLRSIQIIQGKPELAADLQLALFHRDGGRSKWVTLTEKEAVLWLRHPNGDEHTESFTMDDAKRAGLAGGQNYTKHPKAMLRSRAITAGLKSLGFEPTTGVYGQGEISGAEVVVSEVVPLSEVPPDVKDGSTEDELREAALVELKSKMPPRGFNAAGEAVMVGAKRSSPLFGRPIKYLTDTQISEAAMWAAGEGDEYKPWLAAAETELAERKAKIKAVESAPLDQMPSAITTETPQDKAIDARFQQAKAAIGGAK